MGTQDKLITDLYNAEKILKNAELTDKGKLFHKDVLNFISNPQVYLLGSNGKGDISQGSILGYVDEIIKDNNKGIILPRSCSNEPRDGTVFEIFKGDGGGIKIRVYGPSEKRVLHNADFASGAEVQRLMSFPNKLKCIEGTLQKVDDGGYIVTTPPKITLYRD
ncbi:MAG: hypothetical protein ACP5N2_01130 [Candidatus Nanoarchaeia archaeon]